MVIYGLFDWIGDIAGAAAGSVLATIVGAMVQGLTEAIKGVGAWWLSVPSPSLIGESGAAPAERIMFYTKAFVPFVGMISMAIFLPTILIRRSREATITGAFAILRVIFFSGAGLATITILLQVSDMVSPWLVQQISGGTFEDGMGQLFGGTGAVVGSETVGVLVLMIVLIPIALIGSIINMFFLFFSYGAITVMGGLLPAAAAGSFIEQGNKSLKKVLGWILALVLYKPVAGVIYGSGIALMRGITGGISGDQPGGQTVLQMLYGVTIICVAAIALPALLRVIVPSMASGSSGGGAGSMLLGAALLATGAITGGASAGAAAGAGGGASTRAAGASTGAAGGNSGSGAAGATPGMGSSSTGSPDTTSGINQPDNKPSETSSSGVKDQENKETPHTVTGDQAQTASGAGSSQKQPSGPTEPEKIPLASQPTTGAGDRGAIMRNQALYQFQSTIAQLDQGIDSKE
ncbi:hypothetical protein [Lysinibacter sp. HNR]|uniref:hypothetical protein n=1 Tax=Lysinibacter sp. HNR TaxID=3031408 RepID=UPI002434AA56|nr:hypothetical protein [Lysinibacter sp. HNR]WGD37576.1 hypothetical protein FrondiHNR_01230 [Lysinibacter sp. HNR]